MKFSLFQQRDFEGRSSAMKYGILHILHLKHWGQVSHIEYEISVIHRRKFVSNFRRDYGTFHDSEIEI